MLSCASFNKLIYQTAADVTAMASGKSTPVGVDLSSLPLATGVSDGSVGRGAPSETQSEISSVDSDWSDIRAIALKLGVQNPDDLHTERFKVDRQKLEQLIKENSDIEGMNGAEYFFDEIMNTTDTYVSWPCRLKIGAKSKKDPHVRIVGKVEQVQRAKDQILSSLDSRGTRVIMKMDVSYTDHSYIIGRGGNNIKRIMDESHTHIHFPDSNRSNPTEKSNQVSLCGSLEGVERARAMVRLSTPLLISFEMPVMGPGKVQPDHETPYIKMVESKFNVQVIFSSRPKLHTSLVLVKGSEKESAQVRDATQLLINFAFENIANQILVNVQMEISPQHHEIVKGKNNVNLLNIMERTQTKIIFPDLTDMNVKPLKKSQVTISGRIDDVYRARQQLLGNLPVVLIFDFPDNQTDASEIMGLNVKYGVYITLRQKARQSTLAIVIKGIEKFIDKIYEARQEILCLSTPAIKPELPDHYYMPKDKDLNLAYRTQLTALLAGYPDSPKTPSLLPPSMGSQLSPYGNKNHLLLNGNVAVGMTTPTGVCTPTQKYMPLHNSAYQPRQVPTITQNNNTNNNNNNFLQVPGSGLLKPPQVPSGPPSVGSNVSPRNSCSQNTSGYQSFSSSTTSLEQSYPPYGQLQGAVSSTSSSSGGNNNRAHYSPDSTYSSEAGSIAGTTARLGRRLSDGVLLGLGSAIGGAHLLPGSAESYRNLHYDLAAAAGKHQHHQQQQASQRACEFDIQRALGFKAMERTPVAGELRTPTPAWMGMGISRTSPAPIETVDDGSNGGGNTANGWRMPPPPPGLCSPYGLSATTGLLDATPVSRRMQLSQHKDIHTLLTSVGLEHYIKIFVLNEIDLEMFTTLTEENLMELGITAFGARKKLLAAIHTLLANEAACSSMPSSSSSQSSSPRFSGSAAPGAERRPSNQW
ncbi:protein bicaudal C [Drosophila albomicans]|uniref:Protein bicaudal C n=1 Tax=Drosophila albomicans TaxID=7291 RepID=A0A9C6WGQ7_DROAB|nr:protein bicaudal C [Drosophila albomicans]